MAVDHESVYFRLPTDYRLGRGVTDCMRQTSRKRFLIQALTPVNLIPLECEGKLQTSIAMNGALF